MATSLWYERYWISLGILREKVRLKIFSLSLSPKLRITASSYSYRRMTQAPTSKQSFKAGEFLKIFVRSAGGDGIPWQPMSAPELRSGDGQRGVGLAEVVVQQADGFRLWMNLRGAKLHEETTR